MLKKVKLVNEYIKLTRDVETTDIGKFISQCQRSNLISELHKQDLDISSSMSKSKFTSELVEFIQDLSEQNKPFKEPDYKAFVRRLKNITIDSYDVYAELFGVKIRRNVISFGDFTIYDAYQSYRDIIEKYPKIGNDVYDVLKKMHITLVCISVNARDSDKAREIATEYFRRFEYTLFYYITPIRQSSTYVRLLHSLRLSSVKLMCVTDNFCYEYKSTPEGYTSLKLDSYVNVYKKASNPILWRLITKKRTEMTPIEKRLSLSIEWNGKANIEKNRNQALLLYCMAVETLVTLSKGNQTLQFKENTAFINGDKIEVRKDIVKRMGSIYDKRCRIVHGSDDGSDVSISDVDYIQKMVYNLVDRFTNLEPLCSFKSVEDLANWIAIEKC